MDLLVYNGHFQPMGLVDDYESLIWTERYYSAGDFELVVYPTEKHLSLLLVNRYIYLRESEHWMVIEGVEIKTDVENGNRLIVSGRSMESILDRRIVWNLTTFKKAGLQDAIMKLMNENLIKPAITERRLPNWIFKATTDPRITRIKIDAEYMGDNLYDVISGLCEESKIGFKVTINENFKFVFELYSGDDRTYDQTQNTYVVFSPNFDNLINSNYNNNLQAWKNTTLIGGEGEGADRRFNSIGNTNAGLARREIFTDANSISSNKDDHFDKENYTAYPWYVDPNTKKVLSTFSKRLLYFPCEPNGKYEVSRKMPDDSDLKYHLRLATAPSIPKIGSSVSDVVSDEEKTVDRSDIVAGSNDHYLIVQLFTNGDSLFTEKQFDSYALYINESTNKLANSSTKRLVYVPCTPGGTYLVSRDESVDHSLVIGTCVNTPASGVSLTNISHGGDGGLEPFSARITAGPNDKYLVAQLFSNSDSAFDPIDYKTSSIAIDEENETFVKTLSPRTIQVSCDPGGQYTVSRTSNQYHLVVGTNKSGSSEGSYIGNIVSGSNIKSTATITAAEDEKNLFVQLFTDEDNMFDVGNAPANYLSINTDTLKFDSSWNIKLTYVDIEPGIEYQVLRDIPYSYKMTLATCQAIPHSGGAITSFTTDDHIRAGVSDHYLAIQLFDEEDSQFNSDNYEGHAWGIDTSNKVIVNASSERTIYIRLLGTSHNYKISRSPEMRYTMTIASSAYDYDPESGIPITKYKTYQRPSDESSDEVEFQTNSGDYWLIIQLFNETDYNNGATIEKAIKNLRIEGTGTYATATEKMEVFRYDILDQAMAGLSIPGGEVSIAAKGLVMNGTATLETAIGDLKVSGPMLTEEYMDLLKKKGDETLLDNKKVNEFETEVDLNIMYRYGEHFFMGDRVQIENEYGMTGVALITELVRNHDTNGNTAYPAFVLIE